MIGRIVFKSEYFGFIQGEEGVDYYFKPDLMDLGVPYESMEVGAEVHFNPKPRPKGLRAYSVRHLDKNKNPFYYEPGALYAARVGKECRAFQMNDEPMYSRGRRLHSVIEMHSVAHIDSRLGFLAFVKAVRLAGANLVYGARLSTSLKLLNGHSVTVYIWRAKVGFYVEPKKVGSQLELEQFNAATESTIASGKVRLLALQGAIDLEQASNAWCPSRLNPNAHAKIGLPEDSLESPSAPSHLVNLHFA